MKYERAGKYKIELKSSELKTKILHIELKKVYVYLQFLHILVYKV